MPKSNMGENVLTLIITGWVIYVLAKNANTPLAQMRLFDIIPFILLVLSSIKHMLNHIIDQLNSSKEG